MTLAKAMIVPVDKPGEKFKVMYNPNELSDNYSASYTSESQELEFVSTSRQDFSVNLYYDTYEEGVDVRGETNKIKELMKPRTGSGTTKRPPQVRFIWNRLWFTGVIVNLEQRFTMFLSSGLPVRARVRITLKSSLTEQEQLEDMGFFNCRRLWKVTEGDRLYLIAQKTMGDPTMWRLIAEVNNIYDPLSFPTREQTGMQLAIPDVHDPKIIEAMNDQ